MTGEGAVARLAARAATDVDAIVDAQVARIREREPDYGRVPPEELRANARELLLLALTTLATGARTPTGVARQNARRRAEQRVPLGPLLHAYRLGFVTVWQRLLALAAEEGPEVQLELLNGAESVWAVVDDYSSDVSVAYQEGLAVLAQRDAQRRLDALAALLEGRGADWALLGGSPAVLGLPDGTPYAGLVTELVGPAELTGDRSPEELLRAAGFPAALRSSAGRWVGVVALPHRATVEQLVERLGRLWVGRTGVSEAYADLLATPDAVRDATAAARCLPPGERGVARLTDDRLALLLTTSPELAVATAAAFLGRIEDAPDRELLVATLAAYFDSGSIAETAAALFCHRNTVGRRLRRVEELTGRRLEDPRGGAELFLAVHATRLLAPGSVQLHHGGPQERCSRP